MCVVISGHKLARQPGAGQQERSLPLLSLQVKKFYSDVSYDKLFLFKNGETSLFTLENSRLGSLELNNTGPFELLNILSLIKNQVGVVIGLQLIWVPLRDSRS